jgi:hypothetical protein
MLFELSIIPLVSNVASVEAKLGKTLRSIR